VPVLHHLVSVLLRNPVPVLGVPDPEHHAPEVTSVVQEPPAEQDPERVHHDERLHSGVGRERVRIDLADKRDTQPHVWKGRTDDTHQSQGRTRCTERRNHARPGDLVHVAGKAADNTGRHVRGQKLLLSELAADDGTKGPENVHVKEDVLQAVVTEGGNSIGQQVASAIGLDMKYFTMTAENCGTCQARNTA